MPSQTDRQTEKEEEKEREQRDPVPFFTYLSLPGIHGQPMMVFMVKLAYLSVLPNWIGVS